MEVSTSTSQASLDEEIIRLELDPNAHMLELRMLRLRRNQLALIHRLPNEIISAIFRFTCDPPPDIISDA